MESPISKLPPEIILSVLDFLNPFDLTCFALSNKLHYGAKKYLQCNPVDLGELTQVRFKATPQSQAYDTKVKSLYEMIGE